MNEQSQHNDSLPPAPADQDLAALIRKMQQQLSFLEKKIDILINQFQARPSSERHFSKPFRSFGAPHRYSDRAHANASGEKSFDRARHQEHHFEKRHDTEQRGFDQKKKPFSYRRKDRR